MPEPRLSRLFVSYASDDRDKHVMWLVEKLKASGYADRIWFDRENIEGWRSLEGGDQRRIC